MKFGAGRQQDRNLSRLRGICRNGQMRDLTGSSFIQLVLSVLDPRLAIDALGEANECGPELLKDALYSIAGEPENLINELEPLLRWLGKDELASALCTEALRSVIVCISGIPKVMKLLICCVKQDLLTATQKESVHWFAVYIVGNGLGEDGSAIRLAEAIVEFHPDSGPVADLRMMLEIEKPGLLKQFTGKALEDIRLQSSFDRHNNDKQDYRNIALLPTLDELNFDGEVFLPRNDVRTMASLYDRHFRLLRQDFLSGARDCLKKSKQKDAWSGNKFDSVSIDELQAGGQKNKKPSIIFSFPLARGHVTEKMTWKKRMEYWKCNCLSLLPRGSVILLRRIDGSECIAIVDVRSEELLANGVDLPQGGRILRPKFGVRLCLDYDDIELKNDATNAVKVLQSIGAGPIYSAFLISKNFFSYEPILQRLQEGRVLKLTPTLLEQRHDIPTPSYLKGVDIGTWIDPKLNATQRVAMGLSLSTEVSLVQGPPGTGKTFMERSLVKTLYDNCPSKTILIMAYTNHALDQVLIGLLDMGIGNFIRVGGRSKEDRLKPKMLKEITASAKQVNDDATRRSLWKAYSNRDEMLTLLDVLPVQVTKGGIGWDFINHHLMQNHHSVYEELCMDEFLGLTEDGFERVRKSRKSGSSLKRDTKWKQWKDGFRPKLDDNNEIHSTANRPDSIWKLTKEQRLALVINWKTEIFGDGVFESLANVLNGAKICDDILSRVHNEKNLNCIKKLKPRILGMTSTGAAIYHDILRVFKPDIVIVEEAGEMLEAHVLTAIHKELEHLIMIGDHKQLRPKIEAYNLQVASGLGHDLNRSLFERLIRAGVQCSTLLTQHRMHPEIVQAIMDLKIYPGLSNHNSTWKRDKIPGVSKRLVFVDHREYEVVHENWRAQTDTSKTNSHEVDMVVAICQYLIKQGIAQNEISVLSTYVGQTVAIRQRLTKELKQTVTLNERDLEDLKARGYEVEDNSDTTGSSVIVSSVDNYQGEENKIVIVSLVRSNKECRIGFMAEPERLTVLLTRAQCLLVMIGNSQCLRNAAGNHRWEDLFLSMEANGQLLKGIPVVCERHGTEKILESPEDFSDHSPQGGCNAPCGLYLSCGHRCPLKCHPLESAHSSVRCVILMEAVECKMGHRSVVQCFELNSRTWRCRTCKKLDDIKTKKEKALQVLKKGDQLRLEEVAIEMAKIEADREEAQVELVQEQKETERLKQLQAKRVDCETIRECKNLESRNRNIELEKQLEELEASQKKKIELEEANLLARNLKIVRIQRDDRIKNSEPETKFIISDSSSLKIIERIYDEINDLTRTDAQTLAAVKFIPDPSVNIFLRNTSDLQILDTSKLLPKVSKIIDLLIGAMASEKWLEVTNRLAAMKECPVVVLGLKIAELNANGEGATNDEVKKLNETLGGAGIEVGGLMEAVAKTTVAKCQSISGTPNKEAALEALRLCFHSKNDKVATWGLKILRSHILSLMPDRNDSQQAKLQEEREKATRKQKAKSSPSLRKLEEMIGLEKIKRYFQQISDSIDLDRERETDPAKQVLHLRFDGNPGTGKTTVARLYGDFLKEKDILGDSYQFLETTGAKLISEGLGGIKQIVEETLKEGGLLFIDEAYQLNPKDDRDGAKILNYLLPEMENRRGVLVVVIAGYAKQLDEFMKFNDGLPSRFPITLTFDDYNQKELYEIFISVLKSCGTKQDRYSVNDKWVRIAASRLARQAGMTGFGNARAVRNAVDLSMKRQSSRVTTERSRGNMPDIWMLERDDVLGPKYIDPNTEALQTLQKMIGLTKVKEAVKQIISVANSNMELEDEEKPVRELNLNRVFLGNPGTGKTTVAKLYGQILKSMGLLSNGEVVVKNPVDFLGQYVGQSARNTKAILDNAKGKVLVIDEAYTLNPGPDKKIYEADVIDCIVSEVHGVAGDDRCVLLLGYEEQMEALMREANPGLARRFNLANALRFEDFQDTELLQILTLKQKKLQLVSDFETKKFAVSILAEQRRSEMSFGNGGAIDNLLSQAQLRSSQRTRGKGSLELISADFMDPDEPLSSVGDPAAFVEASFVGLLGCTEVKETVLNFVKAIQYAKYKGRDPLDSISLNFAFLGPPGTGKTTVARLMGKALKSLKLLSKDEVIECSASDFVTGYVGQSGKQTRRMFEKALGGVLFIDEAYRLNPNIGGSFVGEALDEIVQLLTEEQFQNNMSVILAGYPAEVEELFRVNPGLKSRIPVSANFSAFTSEEALKLLDIVLLKKGLRLGQSEGIAEAMRKLVKSPAWSSGRDVHNIANMIYQSHAGNYIDAQGEEGVSGSSETSDELEPVHENLVVKALEKLTEQKQKGKGVGKITSRFEGQTKQAFADEQKKPAFADEQKKPETKTEENYAEPPAREEQKESLESDGGELSKGVTILENRFEALPDDFLRRLNDTLNEMGVATKDLEEVAATDVSDIADLLPPDDFDWLNQWSTIITGMVEDAKAEEEKQRKLGRRPVWQCQICKRAHCKVAPLIIRYEEILL